jgi:hypothetical protein
VEYNDGTVKPVWDYSGETSQLIDGVSTLRNKKTGEQLTLRQADLVLTERAQAGKEVRYRGGPNALKELTQQRQRSTSSSQSKERSTSPPIKLEPTDSDIEMGYESETESDIPSSSRHRNRRSTHPNSNVDMHSSPQSDSSLTSLSDFSDNSDSERPSSSHKASSSKMSGRKAGISSKPKSQQLHERRKSLERLANGKRFMHEIAEELNKNRKGCNFTHNDIKIYKQYKWPGMPTQTKGNHVSNPKYEQLIKRQSSLEKLADGERSYQQIADELNEKGSNFTKTDLKNFKSRHWSKMPVRKEIPRRNRKRQEVGE